MITWNSYKQCSSEFLTEHHDLLLYDIFHHIKALLLFPPNCSCEGTCLCQEWRRKIVLSLNTDLYNKAQSDKKEVMKFLWRIPGDHVFREQYGEAYPLWLIEKELKAREEKGHFESINLLVWTFLRLGETSKFCFKVPEVSVSEAMEILLGDTPLKTKARKLKGAGFLNGEKAYEKNFKHYKSVCHFIAALEFCKDEERTWDSWLACPAPEFVERFLDVADWFRENLLSLERPNVKNKIFLEEEDLCPLPEWLQTKEIVFPIALVMGKIEKLMAKAQLIDPATKSVIKEGPAVFS